MTGRFSVGVEIVLPRRKRALIDRASSWYTLCA
jgi:hypothetical protein